MRLNRMEPFEVEQRLDVALASRVTVEHCLDVGSQRRAELRVGFQHVGVGLRDHDRRHVRMIQPL